MSGTSKEAAWVNCHLTTGLTLMVVDLGVTDLIAGHSSPVLLALLLAVYGLGSDDPDLARGP